LVNYYFNIGIIYFIIGFAVALFFFFVLRKRIFGSFWITLVIALVGSYLGGLIEYFFKDIIEMLTNVINSVNIFPPLITAFVIIWLFSLVSSNKQQ
jgi:ABC-type dipeptide/oligopeptide/nickel transport system permease subunit